MCKTSFSIYTSFTIAQQIKWKWTSEEPCLLLTRALMRFEQMFQNATFPLTFLYLKTKVVFHKMDNAFENSLK